MLICMDKKRKKYEVIAFSIKKKAIADLDAGIITRSELMEIYNVNSETTITNWRKQVERGYGHRHRYFSPELKIKAVNEVLTGLKTENEIIQEYELSSIHHLNSWIKKYRHTPQHRNEFVKMDDNNTSLKEIEQELQQARLKILALESLINTAEKELNYPIRKKYGTKQLKK